MTETKSATTTSVTRLVLIPAVITLGMTILRLVGELQHWSKPWFSTGSGPAIVGVVWLVPIFSVYFALKLSESGEGPPRVAHAMGHAVLGLLVMASGFILLNFVKASFFNLVFMWVLAAAGAALQFPTWRPLFKVLVAYGYAARSPVAIVMFLATRGEWQSHYRALVMPKSAMSSLQQYVLFGLFPQLVWWVAFTVIIGSLCGTVATAIAHRGKRVPQPAS